ncbi:MAG TPA: peptidylprolyl isomerase [Candidatus Syntrophosphaera sp.]|nr:peptidylprolyl isomerase [Candidatus Syntrophosphaera sp.]
MLDSLRKQQKLIVYIVSIAFIVGLAGTGGYFGIRSLIEGTLFSGQFLAKVNGSKISLADFNKKIQEVTERYQQQGQQVDERMQSQIQYSAWDELVNEALWNQQVKKNHIKVTEAEIKNAMENDIPQEIMQNQNLQTNGVFDKAKYFNALNNIPEFKLQLYDYMKTYLPRKKVQDKIKAEAKINADSLKAEYVKDTDSVTGKAIWFDFNRADSVYVPDADVKKYYEANKDKEFKKGPASKIKYVGWDIKPSDQDYNDVKLDIDDIYTRLTKKGENFTQLALDYSEDPGSAKQGGSLGSFGKGQMVPEFDAVAFKMKVGEISKPFKTQFGWHIVRVDSILSTKPGEEKVAASHILFSVKTSDATKNQLQQKAQDAAKLIKRKGIDKAAKELKLDVTTSPWLAHDKESMETIGQNPALFQFMKKKKAGSVSDVIKLSAGGQDKFIVAQVTDNAKTYYEDFEAKKLQIKYDLEKQKKVANVKAKAEEFIKRVPKENYFRAAEAEGWKIIDLAGHKNKAYIPTVNAISEEFSKAALALKSGEYSGLVTTKEGPFVIFAEKRDKPDLKAFAKDKAKQDELRKRLEDAAFNRWWQQLRKDAKIIDNRYKYGY